MKRIFYIISIIFSLSSCSTHDTLYDDFQYYLNNKFQYTIGNEKTYFYLFPNNQCANCIQLKNLTLSDSLNRHIFIVTGLRKSLFSPFKNVLYDQSNEMFLIDTLKYSNTLIITQNQKVIYVKNHLELNSDLFNLK
jgi:hypothetical protein